MRAFVAAILATSSLVSAGMVQAATPPNIIVIMLDDVPDDMRLLPRVAALLPLGTRYTNSFVHQPLCGPSRATFLTGQLSEHHGVTSNGNFLPSLVGLLPQQLRASGYATGIFGKMPNSFKDGNAALLGFNRWATLEKMRTHRYIDPTINDNGAVKEYLGAYSTDVIYGLASTWIDEVRGRPYFAWISAVGGHAPNTPALRYQGACDNVPFEPGPAFNEADVSDKPDFVQAFEFVKVSSVEKSFRDRCATVRADDEWIEKIVLTYASADTCVFLTADNGFMHGQHRATGKNLLYEESIRVPLVMWGCRAGVGAIDTRRVSNVDLPATIYDLTGAAPGRPLDGVSIFGERRRKVPLFGIWSGKHSDPRFSRGQRGKRWVSWEHAGDGSEKYDLIADPFQLNNLK